MDSTVNFSVLCRTLEAVQNARKGPMKRKHVRAFLDQVYTDREFFSALRLMLPVHDKERNSYGLKETVLGKFLAEALCLSKESPDAQKLLNWRKGGNLVGMNAGNFASLAMEILNRRQRVISADLKIKDVNDLLDRLAAATNKEKVAILAEIISKTDAREMRWIILMILKDLKLGISEKVVLSEFHPDAQDLFNVTCNLKEVCERLRNRNERLKKQDIEVGKPVKPQLAARVQSLEDAWKKLRGKQVTVECKFDGERIQIHKNGAELHFYSRAAIDHREYYRGMADVLSTNVIPEKCILDGEMVVWDRQNNCFRPFGSNREAAKAAAEGLDSNSQLCYIVFDLLYSESSSMIHLPLRQRQELLHKAIRPIKLRLEILQQQSIGGFKWSIIPRSLEDITYFFNETVENRDEGVILKDLDSKWDTNDRTGKWLKLKPDYFNAGSDLDVLIIGGYYGSGRRGGQVAQFLLGIANKPSPDDIPTQFYSFCKVGTGYTDDQHEHLVQKLSPYFRRNEKNSKAPSCYRVTNKPKERPDVWVEPPEKSVILEITSDIRTIDTEVFACPYGVRFPRVNRIRYEKPWNDCLSLQELLKTVKDKIGSTVQTGGQGNTEDMPKPNKRQKKSSRNLLPLVPEQFRSTDVSDVKHTTQIFTNLVFYIVNNSVEHSRDSLNKLVVANGGLFTMNLNDTVTHAIASEKKGIKFQASATHGDVIHYSWIIDCCTSKTRLPISPKYFLHLSNQTKEKRKDAIDRYGDYYFLDIDATDMSQIFRNISSEQKATDPDELAQAKNEYGSSLTFNQFSNCHFYFHKPIHSSNPDSQMVAETALKRQELEVTMHGGAVSKAMNSNVTHMVVYTSSEQALAFSTIVKSLSSQDRRFLMSDKLKILSHRWVDDVVGTTGDLKEANYDLRDPSFQMNGER